MDKSSSNEDESGQQQKQQRFMVTSPGLKTDRDGSYLEHRPSESHQHHHSQRQHHHHSNPLVSNLVSKDSNSSNPSQGSSNQQEGEGIVEEHVKGAVENRHRHRRVTKDGKEVLAHTAAKDLRDQHDHHHHHGGIVNVVDHHRSPFSSPHQHNQHMQQPGGSNHLQAVGLSSTENRGGGGEALHRRQPSPANGWPHRSPINSEHHYHHEEGSFNLLTQSFESLADTNLHPAESTEDRDHSPPGKRSSGPPRRIDFVERNDAQNSVGEISPIKLEDPPAIQHQHHRGSRGGGGGAVAVVAAAASGRAVANGLTSSQRLHHHYRQSRRVDFVPAPTYRNYHIEARNESYPFGNGRYDERGISRGNRDPYYGNSYRSTSTSNPIFVLRSAKKAFSGCTYLLPCLLEGEICPVNISRYGSIQNYSHAGRGRPDEAEVKIATRRVEAAICAFGGYLNSNEQEPLHPNSHIFRLRNNSLYDSQFYRRFYVNGDHVSWDMEENPPIESHQESRSPHKRSRLSTPGRNSAENQQGRVGQGAAGDSSPTGSDFPGDSQQKMKYRCKLCGQLKQNHVCPYQKSLQRSIAIMVHPTVNAYTASEPGVLTKSLSEMNNFVSYEDDKHHSPDVAYTQNSSKEKNTSHGHKINHVSPETLKSRHFRSPESSLSTHSPNGASPNISTPRHAQYYNGGMTRKRTGDGNPKGAPPPFAATLNLRPEQYRVVTPSANTRSGTEGYSSSSLSKGDGNGDGEYTYQHVPLTFAERKRLSDTLFCLSKQIPTATVDVAKLLRHAREVDKWDLAVAELLAQIVVSIYCGESDYTLDGLKTYLLEIGISC